MQIAVCTTNSTHAISRQAATSPQNIQRHNFTECFDRNINLARLCTSSLRWSKTETCRSDNYMYSSVKLNFSKFNKKCNCWWMNNIRIMSVPQIVERHISNIHIDIFLKTFTNLKPRYKFMSLSADISRHTSITVAFILCSSFSVMKRWHLKGVMERNPGDIYTKLFVQKCAF